VCFQVNLITKSINLGANLADNLASSLTLTATNFSEPESGYPSRFDGLSAAPNEWRRHTFLSCPSSRGGLTLTLSNDHEHLQTVSSLFLVCPFDANGSPSFRTYLSGTAGGPANRQHNEENTAPQT
jgi:hypothetical protein